MFYKDLLYVKESCNHVRFFKKHLTYKSMYDKVDVGEKDENKQDKKRKK